MNTKELEPHFLQSTYWQQVREAMGHEAVRIGESLLLLKPLPIIGKKVGYMPQVHLESLDWERLQQVAKAKGVTHIQLDPSDVVADYSPPAAIISKFKLKPAESVYYRRTSILDLQQSDEQLYDKMKPKTRYNTRLSSKKGVTVTVDDSDRSFQDFLRLFFETVERQKYYGRTKNYYQVIWNVLQPLGRVKIATAYYGGEALVSWMLFLGENGVIYYPYGGSSEKERNRMPANALVWGVVQWGREQGYKYFDLWGTLEPDAKETDKGYGFSRFKTGFGGTDIAYTQSYDMVISPFWYFTVKLLNRLRWLVLSLRRTVS